MFIIINRFIVCLLCHHSFFQKSDNTIVNFIFFFIPSNISFINNSNDNHCIKTFATTKRIGICKILIGDAIFSSADAIFSSEDRKNASDDEKFSSVDEKILSTDKNFSSTDDFLVSRQKFLVTDRNFLSPDRNFLSVFFYGK